MEKLSLLLTAIGGAVAAVLTAMATLLTVIMRRQTAAHQQMNSRLDELISAVKVTAEAVGFERGRVAAKAEAATDLQVTDAAAAAADELDFRSELERDRVDDVQTDTP